MKTYSLTSQLWEGEVELIYDEMELLVNFDVSRSGMNQNQHVSFLQWLPRTKGELDQLLDKAKHLSLTEVVQNVTFEDFWNRYDEKVRSSKKKTQKIWNRLGKSDQVKAFNFIKKYERSMRDGVSKKYAETYLNAELWNN